MLHQCSIVHISTCILQYPAREAANTQCYAFVSSVILHHYGFLSWLVKPQTWNSICKNFCELCWYWSGYKVAAKNEVHEWPKTHVKITFFLNFSPQNGKSLTIFRLQKSFWNLAKHLAILLAEKLGPSEAFECKQSFLRRETAGRDWNDS